MHEQRELVKLWMLQNTFKKLCGSRSAILPRSIVDLDPHISRTCVLWKPRMSPSRKSGRRPPKVQASSGPSRACKIQVTTKGAKLPPKLECVQRHPVLRASPNDFSRRALRPGAELAAQSTSASAHTSVTFCQTSAKTSPRTRFCSRWMLLVSL